MKGMTHTEAHGDRPGKPCTCPGRLTYVGELHADFSRDTLFSVYTCEKCGMHGWKFEKRFQWWSHEPLVLPLTQDLTVPTWCLDTRVTATQVEFEATNVATDAEVTFELNHWDAYILYHDLRKKFAAKGIDLDAEPLITPPIESEAPPPTSPYRLVIHDTSNDRMVTVKCPSLAAAVADWQQHLARTTEGTYDYRVADADGTDLLIVGPFRAQVLCRSGWQTVSTNELIITADHVAFQALTAADTFETRVVDAFDREICRYTFGENHEFVARDTAPLITPPIESEAYPAGLIVPGAHAAPAT